VTESVTRIEGAVQHGEQERLRREWRQTSATINDALDQFSAAVRLDPSAWSSVARYAAPPMRGRRLGLG
jgi:hypothetical protein